MHDVVYFVSIVVDFVTVFVLAELVISTVL